MAFLLYNKLKGQGRKASPGHTSPPPEESNVWQSAQTLLKEHQDGFENQDNLARLQSACVWHKNLRGLLKSWARLEDKDPESAGVVFALKIAAVSQLETLPIQAVFDEAVRDLKLPEHAPGLENLVDLTANVCLGMLLPDHAVWVNDELEVLNEASLEREVDHSKSPGTLLALKECFRASIPNAVDPATTTLPFLKALAVRQRSALVEVLSDLCEGLTNLVEAFEGPVVPGLLFKATNSGANLIDFLQHRAKQAILEFSNSIHDVLRLLRALTPVKHIDQAIQGLRGDLGCRQSVMPDPEKGAADFSAEVENNPAWLGTIWGFVDAVSKCVISPRLKQGGLRAANDLESSKLISLLNEGLRLLLALILSRPILAASLVDGFRLCLSILSTDERLAQKKMPSDATCVGLAAMLAYYSAISDPDAEKAVAIGTLLLDAVSEELTRSKRSDGNRRRSVETQATSVLLDSLLWDEKVDEDLELPSLVARDALLLLRSCYMASPIQALSGTVSFLRAIGEKAETTLAGRLGAELLVALSTVKGISLDGSWDRLSPMDDWASMALGGQRSQFDCMLVSLEMASLCNAQIAEVLMEEMVRSGVEGISNTKDTDGDVKSWAESILSHVEEFAFDERRDNRGLVKDCQIFCRILRIVNCLVVSGSPIKSSVRASLCQLKLLKSHKYTLQQAIFQVTTRAINQLAALEPHNISSNAPSDNLPPPTPDPTHPQYVNGPSSVFPVNTPGSSLAAVPATVIPASYVRANGAPIAPGASASMGAPTGPMGVTGPTAASEPLPATGLAPAWGPTTLAGPETLVGPTAAIGPILATDSASVPGSGVQFIPVGSVTPDEVTQAPRHEIEEVDPPKNVAAADSAHKGEAAPYRRTSDGKSHPPNSLRISSPPAEDGWVYQRSVEVLIRECLSLLLGWCSGTRFILPLDVSNTADNHYERKLARKAPLAYWDNLHFEKGLFLCSDQMGFKLLQALTTMIQKEWCSDGVVVSMASLFLVLTLARAAQLSDIMEVNASNEVLSIFSPDEICLFATNMSRAQVLLNSEISSLVMKKASDFQRSLMSGRPGVPLWSPAPGSERGETNFFSTVLDWSVSGGGIEEAALNGRPKNPFLVALDHSVFGQVAFNPNRFQTAKSVDRNAFRCPAMNPLLFTRLKLRTLKTKNLFQVFAFHQNEAKSFQGESSDLSLSIQNLTQQINVLSSYLTGQSSGQSLRTASQATQCLLDLQQGLASTNLAQGQTAAEQAATGASPSLNQDAGAIQKQKQVLDGVRRRRMMMKQPATTEMTAPQDLPRELSIQELWGIINDLLIQLDEKDEELAQLHFKLWSLQK